MTSLAKTSKVDKDLTGLSAEFNNGFILKITLISALGGYLFGFDFAVIAGALPFLDKEFYLNSYWEGFITGSLALGAIIGSLVAGIVSDKRGRKAGLWISALIFTLSSISMAVSPSRYFFVLSRFCAGIGVGMASMLSPMYIAEISPAQIRGRMVAINQLTIVCGILITNIVNYFLRNEGESAWRWMFGLGAIPSFLFFLGSLLLPESPRWLMKVGKNKEADWVLNKIGNKDFALKTKGKIEESLADLRQQKNAKLSSKPIVAAVIIGVGLTVFQQFCGINTVFNYTPKIFESIGASQDNQLLQTVFIGGINLIFTIVAMVLVDRLGRRPLMLLGAGGLALLYVAIGQALLHQSFAVTWFILAAIGLYGLSLAPVTWVLISEIFPNRVREKATSVSVLSLWVAYFILVFTFPPLFEKLRDKSFYIYSIVCFLGFIFIFFKVKETKGKTLEQLEDILTKK